MTSFVFAAVFFHNLFGSEYESPHWRSPGAAAVNGTTNELQSVHKRARNKAKISAPVTCNHFASDLPEARLLVPGPVFFDNPFFLSSTILRVRRLPAIVITLVVDRLTHLLFVTDLLWNTSLIVHIRYREKERERERCLNVTDKRCPKFLVKK